MKNLIKSLALGGVLTMVGAAPTLSVQAAGKLFLFAGQSNMAGSGVRTTLTAAERASVTNVLVLVADPNHPPPQAYSYTRFWLPAQSALSNYTAWGDSGGSWGSLNPGCYCGMNEFGPEFTTVRDLASAMGEQIYFAKYANAGTGLDATFSTLYGTWYPDAADPGSPAEYTLSNYKTMVAWANKALAAARVIDPTTEIAGFFFLQGETDATGTATANRYQTNFTSFIARLRSDFGKSTLPVVFGRIDPYWPYANTVRAAQANVDAADANALMVSTDGVEMHPTNPGHYSGEGLKTIGQRFAQAWLTLSPQPPHITCPPNVTVSANAGLCYATGVALGTATATSGGCEGGISVWHNAPAQFNKGVTTVTWTAQDACGRQSTCAQSVTVNDTQPPTITCPANLTVNANDGGTATNVALGSPVTGDNCSVATVLNNAPAAYPLGTNVVTWTVTDGSGNTAMCVQTVTVISPPPALLTISSHEETVIITWDGGVLQEADDMTGGYTDVPGAVSPYTTAVSGVQQFYRTRSAAP